MNATRKLVLLLCVMLLLVQGCAGPVAIADRPGGLAQTNGGGVELAIYAGVGAATVGAFALCGVADLLSLPFAAAGHLEYFFCCRSMFDLCWDR